MSFAHVIAPEEELLHRQVPHNIEVEQALLGAILINNEAWRDALAAVPFDRRLLLLPKCLREEEHCPAPFDEFGLLCKQCGLCSIQDLQEEAERRVAEWIKSYGQKVP